MKRNYYVPFSFSTLGLVIALWLKLLLFIELHILDILLLFIVRYTNTIPILSAAQRKLSNTMSDSDEEPPREVRIDGEVYGISDTITEISVRAGVARIPDYCFVYCGNLATVILPASLISGIHASSAVHR